MKEKITVADFYKKVREICEGNMSSYTAYYTIHALAFDVEDEGTFTQEAQPNDITNLLGFVLKTQMEIQKEKDRRVLLCKDFINKLDNRKINENSFTILNEQIFNKTLFDFAHALGKEASELEDETAWKGWTKFLGNSWDKIEGNKPFSSEHIYNMRMEAIDCLKFTAIIFLILDMDLEMIKEMFIEKTNIKMQQWEKEKE